MSFIGSYQHTIDAKNRITIPAKVKATLGDVTQLKLTIGTEGHIEIYLPADFEAYLAKISALPGNNLQANRFRRLIVSNSFSVDIDSSNRILIPQELIIKANLSKDIIIIGNINKYEIWDKKTYEIYQADSSCDMMSLIGGLDGI